MNLPCGCVMETVGEAFVMTPCSPDCTYYLYAMKQGRKQWNRVEYIVDPEVPDQAPDRFIG